MIAYEEIPGQCIGLLVLSTALLLSSRVFAQSAGDSTPQYSPNTAIGASSQPENDAANASNPSPSEAGGDLSNTNDAVANPLGGITAGEVDSPAPKPKAKKKPYAMPMPQMPIWEYVYRKAKDPSADVHMFPTRKKKTTKSTTSTNDSVPEMPSESEASPANASGNESALSASPGTDRHQEQMQRL